MQPQDQPLMLLHAKFGTRTNPFHREVWRSMIVPANFSIFQLHFILAQVFKLPQDKDVAQISRPAKIIYPEHAITRYQLVTPEQISNGQLEEIARGVYIDKSTCYTRENIQDTSAIIRDSRVYKLEDHFFVSPRLIYEHTDVNGSSQEITVECKHIFTSSRSTMAPRIVAGAGQLEGFDATTASQLDVESLQASFQIAHNGQHNVCYTCVHFQCCTAKSRECHGDCCSYCIKGQSGRASSEEDVHEAWIRNRAACINHNITSMLSQTICGLTMFEQSERLTKPFMA
ncbi:hypothetical protein NQZ79_g5273 [Umbelopsis isabellina]|nr:hypothetical protein NQZ79_g5273 [Umbelopsis isabellina]